MWRSRAFFLRLGLLLGWMGLTGGAIVHGASSQEEQQTQNRSVSWTSAAYQDVFSCSQKVLKMNPDMNDKVALADDLLYIRDNPTKSIYVYTPDFAGRSSLELDKNGRQIGQGFVRLPYWPSDTSDVKGFWYLSFGTNGLFLPGKAQARPDFKSYKAPGYVAITSINGKPWPPDDYESYPLEIEDEIWDASAKNKISAAAVEFLVNNTASRLQFLPPAKASGFHVLCPGAGCIDESATEQSDAYNNSLQKISDACQSVATKYHLALYPPQGPSNASSGPARTIKLTIKTEPSGAWCRCDGKRFWGQETRQSYLDTIFSIDQTPGFHEIPAGEYLSITCRCTLESAGHYCRNTSLQFYGDLGGAITHDMVREKNFAESDGSFLGSGDCRHINPSQCRTGSDCFNTGSSCMRKDLVWYPVNGLDYTPAQRQNSKGCRCFKGKCDVTPEFMESLRHQTTR